jgi:dipeptidyl aminopeptidase/acylaminoacyl peptidase
VDLPESEQSIQFYEAVKSIGKVETELVIYPGQPHGVRDPRLVRDLMMRNVEWFTRWIPPDEVATTDSGSSP